MRAIVVILLLLPSLAAGPTTKVTDIDASETRLIAKLKEVTARQLFDELSRLSGETFDVFPPNLFEFPPLVDERFSAEFDRQPYWSALLESTEQAKLAISAESWGMDGPRGRLRLGMASGQGKRPFCIDGPILFVLEQFERSNRIFYGDVSRRRDQVRLSANILAEPKLRPFCTIGKATVTTAIDDAGNHLADLPFPPRPLINVIVNSPPPSFAVLLEYPEKPGARLSEVSGEVEIIVPKQIVQAVIPIEGEEATVAVGANQLDVRVARSSGAVLEVFLQLMREEDSDEAWAASAKNFVSLPPRITVQTNKRTLAQGRWSSGSASVDRAIRHSSFMPGIAADETVERLTVELPVGSQTIAAKFKFVDLPMP